MTDEQNEETDNKQTFEADMKKLEHIIHQLEEGDVPLEKAIDMYQTGMKLSKRCHDQLQRVEKQMDQIVKETGETVPLNEEEGKNEFSG
ncbi:exodeoxyribonuclease VII small subunit [Natribacillus halophilus]|uniref:Exodeoxyribonuclease 7 small subunit n=1 Tax=Natribacillus halophilus TaxID=549003 RepID=A0A1G8JLM7_9BACI|nr:exodeoxyribonuclease VII small subunit [Natribacillus halophilus]SDI31550.1 Exodeoxyribonuclease VII small subunit [Natribacillus halophilus]